VAPIALYPDALVAQILAATTYPVQIVEAARWMQQQSDLSPDQIAAAADSQAWDPSVKALTQFPSVLAMLDTNLAWTSALGDAYVNHPQDVLDAVQILRKQARDAGHLQSTPEEVVTSEEGVITVEPANPEVVYVPVYDPCTIYGWRIVVYPGWQCVFGPPIIVFGVGIPIGWWPSTWGWGWHAWGFDWHRRVVRHNHADYVTRTNTFRGRGVVREPSVPSRPPAVHGVPSRRPGVSPGTPPRGRSNPVDRGFGQPRTHTGTRSGALSGIGQGGSTRSAAERGRASRGTPTGGGRRK
jgi:hypothetical protein